MGMRMHGMMVVHMEKVVRVMGVMLMIVKMVMAMLVVMVDSIRPVFSI